MNIDEFKKIHRDLTKKLKKIYENKFINKYIEEIEYVVDFDSLYVLLIDSIEANKNDGFSTYFINKKRFIAPKALMTNIKNELSKEKSINISKFDLFI